MPGAVAEAGLAHEVLPLDQIAPRLVRLACDLTPRSAPALTTATS
jgi:chemotaxis response regulator CheB